MPRRSERTPDVVRTHELMVATPPAYDSEYASDPPHRVPRSPIGHDDGGRQALDRHEIPLERWRLQLGRFAGCAALVAGGEYLAWRVGTVRGAGAAGALFWLAEALNFAALAITVMLIWRVQARRTPDPASMTINVFVTVCGEPARMVERTLHAALAIEGRVALYVLNDGRIAGKPSWPEIDALCALMGVPCFARTHGAIGKAANLNHALARTDGQLI